MSNFAATFDTQLSPIAPFIFYIAVAGIIFIETAFLVGFFLPGDSLLFSAGLVAAARTDINVVILVFVVFLAAFIGDQVGYVLVSLTTCFHSPVMWAQCFKTAETLVPTQ